MTRSYEAVNRFGKVVRTFGSKVQAEAYRDDMAALGSIITVRLAWVQRREIAA